MAVTINGSTGVQLDDNDKQKFGTGGDLEIYHDGNKSYIQDSGTGSLRIISNDLRIYNAANNEYMARFVENGSAELYYDNSKKLSTTSTGIKVESSSNTTLHLTSSTSSSASIEFGDTDDDDEAEIWYDNYSKKLNFRTTEASDLVFYRDGTEKTRITSDGLTFNGDTAADNALDDYEDGTWTPNPHDGSVTSAAAKYRKIGNQVTIWAQLLTFSDTSTNDQIRIKGLPYAPSSGWHGAAGAAMMQEVSEATGWIAYAQNDQVRFYASSTGGYAQLRHNELDSGHQIYFTATYPVN